MLLCSEEFASPGFQAIISIGATIFILVDLKQTIGRWEIHYVLSHRLCAGRIRSAPNTLHEVFVLRREGGWWVAQIIGFWAGADTRLLYAYYSLKSQQDFEYA